MPQMRVQAVSITIVMLYFPAWSCEEVSADSVGCCWIVTTKLKKYSDRSVHAAPLVQYFEPATAWTDEKSGVAMKKILIALFTHTGYTLMIT